MCSSLLPLFRLEDDNFTNRVHGHQPEFKSHPRPTLQHCIFAFQPQRGDQPTLTHVPLPDVLSLCELITMQSADHGLKHLDPEAKINVSSFLASL